LAETKAGQQNSNQGGETAPPKSSLECNAHALTLASRTLVFGMLYELLPSGMLGPGRLFAKYCDD
jgi:hypothetical protein